MKKQFFAGQISKKLSSIKKRPQWLIDYPNYNDQIKLIRETLGMTQAQLARLANCSSRYIQSIESGRGLPSMSTIKNIANILNAKLKIILIPQQEISKYLDEKATQKARQIVGLNKASSSLELQTPSDEARKEQIESMKREILEKRRNSLWE
jgi:transcriptional regulator with XRE-family HTH domain